MTLLEDVRLLLHHWCDALGFSSTAGNVVPVVVLGILLNALALSTVESIWTTKERPACRKTALRSAARAELKVMRNVVSSAVRTVSRGQRGWCIASTWVDGLSSGLRSAGTAVEQIKGLNEFWVSKSMGLSALIGTERLSR
jgi:hypothetical protein